ncbi:MAG: PilZ domain-containing protein [Spirochaetota bacterium]|nr:MAG: PilZ domain-containing protein [Spirochaetota bacterium]
MSTSQEKEILSTERIKRIVDILRLDGREVELHFPHYIEVAKITDTAAETFKARLTSPGINLRDQELEFLHISFIFSGVGLIGRCPVIEKQAPYITLEYPTILQSRIKRRHPRIMPKNPISAKLKYKHIPQRSPGKVTPKDLPVKYSKLYWEAQRESVDIKKLFLLIGREIKQMSQDSGIVLYNDSNINTQDARIMRESGKVLFINDTSKQESYTRFIPSDKIINYSFYLNERKLSGASPEENKKELQEIIDQDRKAGYVSKVMVPIFSQDEVIGHIKVFKKSSESPITYEDVSDLMALSLLLKIGVENAGFIPSFDDSIDSSLLNISEGGLYLQISGSEEKALIPEGADAQIKFVLNDREVVLRGNICRKDDDESSYAIQFDKLESTEKNALKEFINKSIEHLKGSS